MLVHTHQRNIETENKKSEGCASRRERKRGWLACCASELPATVFWGSLIIVIRLKKNRVRSNLSYPPPNPGSKGYTTRRECNQQVHNPGDINTCQTTSAPTQLVPAQRTAHLKASGQSTAINAVWQLRRADSPATKETNKETLHLHADADQ